MISWSVSNTIYIIWIRKITKTKYHLKHIIYTTSFPFSVFVIHLLPMRLSFGNDFYCIFYFHQKKENHFYEEFFRNKIAKSSSIMILRHFYWRIWLFAQDNLLIIWHKLLMLRRIGFWHNFARCSLLLNRAGISHKMCSPIILSVILIHF